ncbi:hypothetical protein BOM_0101 [Borrelia miyamotoi FR64b]|nr:hypothetical protein [Borrelia miyamotoi]AHH04644.1 hypothetical protein BOM_0101 [Borrelia miyamotoi FR64b]
MEKSYEDMREAEKTLKITLDKAQKDYHNIITAITNLIPNIDII